MRAFDVHFANGSISEPNTTDAKAGAGFLVEDRWVAPVNICESISAVFLSDFSGVPASKGGLA